jgi:hypothetical protein
LGYVSALGCKGRTIWIADAHRDDGKRFVVRADEKLTAFLELEAAIFGGNSRSADSREKYQAKIGVLGARPYVTSSRFARNALHSGRS